MNMFRRRGTVNIRRLKAIGCVSRWRIYRWGLEVKVSRKVDSSAGAGLNGEGMCDVGEVLKAVGLMGDLPDPFLILGIVATLCRCASPKLRIKTCIRS